jgi:hypothetical protein
MELALPTSRSSVADQRDLERSVLPRFKLKACGTPVNMSLSTSGSKEHGLEVCPWSWLRDFDLEFCCILAPEDAQGFNRLRELHKRVNFDICTEAVLQTSSVIPTRRSDVASFLVPPSTLEFARPRYWGIINHTVAWASSLAPTAFLLVPRLHNSEAVWILFST